MKKDKREILASKAQKIDEELKKLITENSTVKDDMELTLEYNSWQHSYNYRLKTKTGCQQFTVEQLNALKRFLNSINILE